MSELVEYPSVTAHFMCLSDKLEVQDLHPPIKISHSELIIK